MSESATSAGPGDSSWPGVLAGASEDEAALVVYGVHGRGQSPEFITELAQRVGSLDRIRWVMPAAPEQSWYPQGFMQSRSDNEPHVTQALERAGEDLRRLLAGSTPVVALGFSQGACVLAEVLLTEQLPVAAAVLHTGGYLDEQPRSFESSGRLAGVPVHLLTAREDDWVPLHRVEETEEAFSSVGAQTDLTVYDDTEHRINDDAVKAIRHDLDAVIQRTGDTVRR